MGIAYIKGNEWFAPECYLSVLRKYPMKTMVVENMREEIESENIQDPRLIKCISKVGKVEKLIRIIS